MWVSDIGWKKEEEAIKLFVKLIKHDKHESMKLEVLRI